jgi:hypothetical protein
MNLERALRDAAEPVPARVAQAPAQDLLDRIVRTPARSAPVAAARRRPRKTLIAAFAAVAAVAATAALVLPNLNTAPAYASWTPDPRPLSAADRSDFTSRCSAEVRRRWGYDATDNRAFGERRGGYAYLNLITRNWTSTCFLEQDGTVSSDSIFTAPISAVKLGRKGVELQNWGQSRTREGYCRLASGHVGTQVTGVDITVRSATGDHVRTVHATLQDGYFLAWYPEGVHEADTNRTSLTLRLADGTTVGDISARDLSLTPILD